MVRKGAKIMKVEHRRLNPGIQQTLHNNIIASQPLTPTHAHKIPVCNSKNSWKGREKDFKRRNGPFPGLSFQASFHNHSSGSLHFILRHLTLQRQFQHKKWRPPPIPEQLPGQEATLSKPTFQQKPRFCLCSLLPY